MFTTMPHKSRLKLPRLDLGPETIGQRLTRLRKAKGLTQVELAKEIGLIQGLISDYERDRLRLHAEMVARFARALGVTADEVVGLKPVSTEEQPPTRRLLHRLRRIEELTLSHQRALLKMIDVYLRGAASSPTDSSRRAA